MAVQVAVPSTKRVSHRVADMMYASDVGVDGFATVDIPACAAANATALMNAQSIATAGSAAPTVAQTEALMSRYGRNLTVVASGTATSNVTISGYDYLGQAMKESFTLTSATPVVGKKIFRDVSLVTFGATAAITINVGTGSKLGVPYKVLGTQLIGELTDDATPTAGTLAAGVNAQTLTSDDPRGSYVPNSAPNGTRTYRFSCNVDRSNLHGSAHVIA